MKTQMRAVPCLWYVCLQDYAKHSNFGPHGVYAMLGQAIECLFKLSAYSNSNTWNLQVFYCYCLAITGIWKNAFDCAVLNP